MSSTAQLNANKQQVSTLHHEDPATWGRNYAKSRRAIPFYFLRDLANFLFFLIFSGLLPDLNVNVIAISYLVSPGSIWKLLERTGLAPLPPTGAATTCHQMLVYR